MTEIECWTDDKGDVWFNFGDKIEHWSRTNSPDGRLKLIETIVDTISLDAPNE